MSRNDDFSTAALRRAYDQAKTQVGVIVPARTMIFQSYNRILYGLRVSLDHQGDNRLEIWYKYQTHKNYITPYEMAEGKWNLALVLPKGLTAMKEADRNYLFSFVDSENKLFHQKLTGFWNKQVPKMVHCLNSPNDKVARNGLNRMTMKMLPSLNVEDHGTRLNFSKNAIKTLLSHNLL